MMECGQEGHKLSRNAYLLGKGMGSGMEQKRDMIRKKETRNSGHEQTSNETL